MNTDREEEGNSDCRFEIRDDGYRESTLATDGHGCTQMGEYGRVLL
jgi:hypothetical protein